MKITDSSIAVITDATDYYILCTKTGEDKKILAQNLGGGGGIGETVVNQVIPAGTDYTLDALTGHLIVSDLICYRPDDTGSPSGTIYNGTTYVNAVSFSAGELFMNQRVQDPQVVRQNEFLIISNSGLVDFIVTLKYREFTPPN